LLAHGGLDAQRSQAGLGVAAVPADMPVDKPLQVTAVAFREGAAAAQGFTHRLVAHRPGLHGVEHLRGVT
jgi:hypothetical protein